MDLNSTTTTNKLLLLLVIPLVFYILQLLSFIFIPLVFAIFLSLLFMPTMRWLEKRKVPRFLSVIAVLIILTSVIFGVTKMVEISSQEIRNDKTELYKKLDAKAGPYLKDAADYVGIERSEGESVIKTILTSEQMSQMVYNNFGITFNLAQKTVNKLLITIFFMVLLLAGSMNFKEVLQLAFFKKSYPSIRTFMVIEKSIVKFLYVKTFVSFLTGLTIGLVAYFFDLSFPIFWGLFAFTINFVQMIGSIIVIVLLSLQAFIEINAPGTLLFAILLITATQLLYGSIVEPVMLGRSFSINVIAVLIMLMFWGFLWGVSGLVLSIPLTVLIKTILEQFPNTRRYAVLLS